MASTVIGIDPGVTGAIAVIKDGKLVGLIDMPTIQGVDGKRHINATAVFNYLKQHTALCAIAKIERVNAMPNAAPGKDGKRAKMGSQSAFNFGEGYGAVKAAVHIAGFSLQETTPIVWKRKAGLIGTPKDQSRLLAKRLHPNAELHLKKHHGRADAICIAMYG